jgi:hypothetical protein
MESQRMTFARPYITRFVAGLAIGLGTVGALFAVASAAASNLSGSFASVESDSHRRNADFDPARAGTGFLHGALTRSAPFTRERR